MKKKIRRLRCFTTYYYDESDESKFEQKKVEGKNCILAATMIVTEGSKRD